MKEKIEYIKMCKQAREYLMKFWKGNPGDIFFNKITNTTHIVIAADRGDLGAPTITYWNKELSFVITDEIIPIFRQDQLLELVVAEVGQYRWSNLVAVLNEYLRDSYIDTKDKNMEQSLIMYVMMHKFRKMWSNGNWEVAE